MHGEPDFPELRCESLLALMGITEILHSAQVLGPPDKLRLSSHPHGGVSIAGGSGCLNAGDNLLGMLGAIASVLRYPAAADDHHQSVRDPL